MAVRKVTQIGHPVLRTKSVKVTSFYSSETLKLIMDLTDTMHKTGLVGIASTQIGSSLQVFLTHPRNTKTRKLFREDILRVFINPKITNFSKETITIYEGCGSVADGEIFGPVIRPRELTVVAFDENGKKFTLTCDGLLSRIIQHEMDHLNGFEFIQKVSDYTKMVSGKHYRKSIKYSAEHKEAIKITKIQLS